MLGHFKETFRKVKSIIPEFFASTTASAANSTTISVSGATYTIGQNAYLTVQCTTGLCWINPIGTATTNSWRMEEGESLNLQVENTLSVISDSITAKLQAIEWY